MLALLRLCIVVSVVDTSANERSNDCADNLYDGSGGGRMSKLYACAHIWGFNLCYEWIHDEGSLESGDDGVGSYVADSVGLHSLESLVREIVRFVADLLRFAVSHSAYTVGFP